jgi:heme/copper-type cytochrome/quinol oxidase subunit 3
MKVITLTGIVLCIVLAACEGFFNGEINSHPNSKFYRIAGGISDTLVLSFLVIEGVILIASICRINSAMKRQPHGQRADIKALVIHSAAFGLFLVSIIIVIVTFILLLANPNSSEWLNVFFAS